MPDDHQREEESDRDSYPIDPSAVESSGGAGGPQPDAEAPERPGGDQTGRSPEDADTDLDADLPVEVKREFLVQVILLNLGLLAVALGAMLLYFRWWLDLGGGLIVIGLVAILLAYRRYVDRPSVE